MDCKEAFKKLSLKLFNKPIVQPKKIKNIQEELKNTNTQVKAMRAVISMMQQGYDMGMICCDVLKVIDTKDAELKYLCNLYLKTNVADRPACQLMCTHTFLKDFNDRNWKIQRSAIADAVQLADEIILKNYIYDIKRMCLHEREEIRSSAANSLSIIYQKSNGLFFENGFDKMLRKLVKDNEESVYSTALKSVSRIEADQEFFSIKEIRTLLSKFETENNIEGIRHLLGIMKYKIIGTEFKPTLLKLLKYFDVSIFYLASKLLVSIDETYYQLVFDQACLFLSMRDEQLYNLLIFMFNIIDFVDYSNNLFVISSCDPVYVRKIKIMLLFKKIDQISEKEIIRESLNGELNLLILENCLKHDFLIENLLDNLKEDDKEQALKIIVSGKIPEGWTDTISSFIYKQRKTKDPRIYLEASGKICNLIPGLVFTLDTELYGKEVIRFFCRMLERKKITKDQCINYLTNFKTTLNRRVRLIIENIEWADPDEVCIVEIEGYVSETLPSLDFEGNGDRLMNCKPCKSDDLNSDEDVSIEVKNLPLFIDMHTYKGLLYISNSKVILETDVIENEIQIAFEIGSKKTTKTITKEEKLELLTLNTDNINKYFKLNLENNSYSVYIDPVQLVRPSQMTEDDFEERYEKMIDQVVLNSFDTNRVFFLDETRFSFSLLENIILGRTSGDSYTLKGDVKVLAYFKNK